MSDENIEADFTRYTILTIFFVGMGVLLYAINIDLLSLVNQSVNSFYSTSSLVFSWRLICLSVGICAIIYMFNCGPGNMRVQMLKNSEEVIYHPDGIEKFITFSSWTLLVNVIYFASASLVQTLDYLEISSPQILSQIQVITFCTGIAIAFLTATIVRHIILPDEAKLGRKCDHMFLFHEQVMHNFAAIFLAIELIILRPKMIPEFAIFGLFLGIIYVVFAYLFAYFGGGYLAYSFIHPKPKIAPFLVIGLASFIAIFYTGLWFISTLDQVLAGILLSAWVMLIVQFKRNK
tara:strand:+ start:609 stop:1481 length:873 start_codon:yes stop_codon:yes gene_type:complete